jgi:hypothetical protein
MCAKVTGINCKSTCIDSTLHIECEFAPHRQYWNYDIAELLTLSELLPEKASYLARRLVERVKTFTVTEADVCTP